MAGWYHGVRLLDDNHQEYRDVDGKLATMSYVYDATLMDYVVMTQPVIKTDSLTVSGTMDLTKIGGVAVGAGNALHVQPGTAAVFPVSIDQTTPGTTNAVQPKDKYGWKADCTANSELLTTSKIRLVGSIFNGAVVDQRFWTPVVSTGTVTQVASELVLTSGTANAHYAKVYSVRRANWITGTNNKFRTQMRIASSDNDVTLRMGVGWGAAMPTVTDGAYFKIVGSAISVCTMAATSETAVASANFNGTYAAPTLTNNNTYEILLTLGKVYFLINDVIVHTATFATTHWTSGTINFHAFADVINTGDSDAIKYTFRMMNISRLGSMITKPQYYRISGVAATHVLKLGGGVLHRIIFNNTTLITQRGQALLFTTILLWLRVQ